MRSPSDTVKEIFWNSGAVPYRFESPCALIIGGKLFGLLLESVYPRRVRGAKSGGVNKAIIQNIAKLLGAAAKMQSGLEPIAAVGEPPARIADGDRRGQRPPERKRHIGNKAKHGEGDPKYLALHISILDASLLLMSRRRAKMFQIQMLVCPAIPMTPSRSQHD
jgi:hypothetical protein